MIVNSNVGLKHFLLSHADDGNSDTLPVSFSFYKKKNHNFPHLYDFLITSTDKNRYRKLFRFEYLWIKERENRKA